MKNAVADLNTGAAGVLHQLAYLRASRWQASARCSCLQNALQAGSLVASQPMLTVGDALISIAFGVTLFNEELRGGWWLLPQIVALAAIIVGLRADREVPTGRRYLRPGLGNRVDGTVIL